MVDPDYTATVGLDRDQARALVAAADADTGAQALRTAAVVRLLLHNALRVDEACAADIADIGEDSGHRVLRVVRKGGRKAKVPLTPATVAALETSLADRAQRAGVASWRELAGTSPGLAGPGSPPESAAARPGRVSAAEVFGQLFPSGVQMTGELLADLEQWARLTGKLTSHGGAPDA